MSEVAAAAGASVAPDALRRPRCASAPTGSCPRRPGCGRRPRADARLDGRRSPGRHGRDRRRPLSLALARPTMAQGRDERQRPAAHRPDRRLRRRRAARDRRPGRPDVPPGHAFVLRSGRRLRAARATQGFGWLETLWSTIASRAEERPSGSYTTSLLDGGVDAVGRKVTEEATELLLAAKDDATASTDASRACPGRRGGRSPLPRPGPAGGARPPAGHRLDTLPRTARPLAARSPSSACPAPDLAAALADPDLEPLPGDGFRDERRVRHPRPVDRHAARRRSCGAPRRATGRPRPPPGTPRPPSSALRDRTENRRSTRTATGAPPGPRSDPTRTSPPNRRSPRPRRPHRAFAR